MLRHALMASFHASDSSAKALASAVILRKYTWLCSSSLTVDAKVEGTSSFKGDGLFSNKVDELLEKLKEIRLTAVYSFARKRPTSFCSRGSCILRPGLH